MRVTYAIVYLLLSVCLIGCGPHSSSDGDTLVQESSEQYSDSTYQYLAIPQNQPLSAASKRALARNYAQGPEGYFEFYDDLKADVEKSPLEALKWGLTHRYASRDWQYIRRFESYQPFSP